MRIFRDLAIARARESGELSLYLSLCLAPDEWEDAEPPGYQQPVSVPWRSPPAPASAPAAAPRAAADLPPLRAAAAAAPRAEPARTMPRMQAPVVTQGETRPSWWQSLRSFGKDFR